MQKLPFLLVAAPDTFASETTEVASDIAYVVRETAVEVGQLLRVFQRLAGD